MPYFINKKIIPHYNEKYIYYAPDITNDFLHVVGAGIVYPDRHYGFEKVRDCHIFEYIVHGTGHIKSDGKVYKLSAGDCVIGRQGIAVNYFSDKEQPYIKLWFSVTGSYVDSLLDSFGFKEAVTVVSASLQSKFEIILSDLECGRVSHVDMAHRLLDICFTVKDAVSMAEALDGEKVAERKEKLSEASHIKAYIDTYINLDVSLEKIASHFGTSKKKIIDIFKRDMGMTPHSYVKKERLACAKRMLEGTDSSITEIAQAAGFCEQSYFSSEFKKAFGSYPTEYRAACRKNAEKYQSGYNLKIDNNV